MHRCVRNTFASLWLARWCIFHTLRTESVLHVVYTMKCISRNGDCMNGRAIAMSISLCVCVFERVEVRVIWSRISNSRTMTPNVAPGLWSPVNGSILAMRASMMVWWAFSGWTSGKRNRNIIVQPLSYVVSSRGRLLAWNTNECMSSKRFHASCRTETLVRFQNASTFFKVLSKYDVHTLYIRIRV